MIHEGEILNDTYIIGKEIGSGGGGTIFSAYHDRLKKKVAIKKIHDNGNYDVEIVRREADILKNLKHSYLPQVFDFLMLDSGVYTVMDFIEGKSLEEILKAETKLNEKKVIKYGIQICEALAYLHSQHPVIIHGDIKPANIMITPDDNVCLIDFNISGVADENGNAYVLGLSKGYAAPEQYREFARIKSGQGNCKEKNKYPATEKTEIISDEGSEKDKAKSKSGEENKQGISISTMSDIYSFAATMYRMLTGDTVPTDNGSSLSVDASDGLCIILNKALANEPRERYGDAGEMLSAMKNIRKLDGTYRRIVWAQNLFLVFFVLFIAAGIVLIILGKNRMDTEAAEEYDNKVEELASSRESGDYGYFEETYSYLLELNPNRYEAYYQYARYLYENKRFEEGTRYIDDILGNKSALFDNDSIAVMYELLGRCYFELNDYETAWNAYTNAIRYNPLESEYYIEAAIAFASGGETAKAQEMLLQAEEMGVDNDRVLLTYGEIYAAEKDYDKAIECFDECIKNSTDSYVRMRAYIFSGDVYFERASSDDLNIEEQIELYKCQTQLLEKAKNDLPDDYRYIVLNEMGKGYIAITNIADVNERDYTDAVQSAISVYREIESFGYADFGIYSNLVVLYEKSGDIEAAEKELLSVKDKYEDYYGFYKRYAFIEVEIQNSKPVSERDYSNFIRYYKQAKNMYETESSQTDGEMIILEHMAKELLSVEGE